MPIIKIEPEINSGIKICFDLSRSIDLHKISTQQTNEQAISGKISGLIELNESVTWKAKHFGICQKLTSKITEFEKPNQFVDEMVSGIFKNFKHEHIFTNLSNRTLMTDIFAYESPLGVLGKLADKLFVKKYMTKLLEERNRVIKEYAESNQWKKILNEREYIILNL